MATSSGPAAASSKKFAFEEVAKHKSKDSLWIVVEDRVYDVTKFLHEVKLHNIFRLPMQSSDS